MSKFKTISYLRKELQHLNQEIDHRIMSGKSYQKLAERHRGIVGKIDRTWNQMNFARAFKFLSLV
jgi:hypothetical protein